MSTAVYCPELSVNPEVKGVISTWFAVEGQTVKQGQLIAEIAIDKVTMDIESPAEGTIRLLADEESVVTSGQLIAEIN